MQIKFSNTKYNLMDTINQHGTHFQASIKVSTSAIPTLLEELDTIKDIEVFNDSDEISATYSGFTQKVAVTVFDTEEKEFKNVSVELENTDINALIAQLSNRVKELENTADNTNSNLEALNASQEEQNETIDSILMS